MRLRKFNKYRRGRSGLRAALYKAQQSSDLRPQTSEPIGTRESTFYVERGQRIAEHRKAVGLTQVQLAEQLGIAQETMAHFEGGKLRVAVATLIPLCEALNIGMEELAGVQPKRSTGKRGPQPKIAQQLERIQAQPAAEQRAIVKVLDSVLAAHQ